jgi:acetyltransferase-like isoleucine patch superfamily enzyme
MLRQFLNKIARVFKGAQYSVAPDVPTDVLLALGTRRAFAIVRGLLRLRALVFVDHGVVLRNKRFLYPGRGCTLQCGVYIDAFAKNGVHLGSGCNIGPFVRIQATGVITQVGSGLRLGTNCGVGAFSFFGCGGGVNIGNNVIMGQYVSFHAENHNHEDLESPIRLQGVTRLGISVGDNCWIGAKSTFLDGARVGSGVIVAAGSVVRGEVPNNVIIGGIPAKVIKVRMHMEQQ